MGLRVHCKGHMPGTRHLHSAACHQATSSIYRRHASLEFKIGWGHTVPQSCQSFSIHLIFLLSLLCHDSKVPDKAPSASGKIASQSTVVLRWQMLTAPTLDLPLHDSAQDIRL